jgi:hypothetical protein
MMFLVRWSPMSTSRSVTPSTVTFAAGLKLSAMVAAAPG